MASVVELYEALASAPDDRARARVIASAIERLEERYPHLPDLVTQHHLRETELRLQKEIEQLRGELETEIERPRVDITTALGGLGRDIEADLEQLRVEIPAALERSRHLLLMWLVPLMLAQVGAIVALVKLL